MASFTLMGWNVESLFLHSANATGQVREGFHGKLTSPEIQEQRSGIRRRSC